MLGLRFDTELLIALIGVVVADGYPHIDTDICRCPAIAVSGMLFVGLLDQSDDFFALRVARGWLPTLPLVVPGPADSHQGTDVLDGVVAGQQVHYFELFYFKRTYSRSPSAFV